MYKINIKTLKGNNISVECVDINTVLKFTNDFFDEEFDGIESFNIEDSGEESDSFGVSVTTAVPCSDILKELYNNYKLVSKEDLETLKKWSLGQQVDEYLTYEDGVSDTVRWLSGECGRPDLCTN